MMVWKMIFLFQGVKTLRFQPLIFRGFSPVFPGTSLLDTTEYGIPPSFRDQQEDRISSACFFCTAWWFGRRIDKKQRRFGRWVSWGCFFKTGRFQQNAPDLKGPPKGGKIQLFFMQCHEYDIDDYIIYWYILIIEISITVSCDLSLKLSTCYQDGGMKLWFISIPEDVLV